MTPLYVENQVLMVGYFSESTTPGLNFYIKIESYSAFVLGGGDYYNNNNCLPPDIE